MEYVILVMGILTSWFLLKRSNNDEERNTRIAYDSNHLKNRFDLEQVEKHRLRDLSQRIMPYSEKFVASYIKGWGKWPNEIYIPDEDIKTFSTLLEKEYNIYTTFTTLRDIIKEQADILKCQHFRNSFHKIHGDRVAMSNDYNKLADAYVKTFCNNLDYVPCLALMLKQSGCGVELETLRAIIKFRYEKTLEEQKFVRLKKRLNSPNDFELPMTMEEIDNMDGLQFEDFLSKLFSKMGYGVQLTKASGDQGADLIIEKYGDRTAVQAKCYTGNVGNAAVQEVIGAKNFYHCSEAIVVSNRYYTPSAMELAKVNSVDLWNRNKLVQLISEYW